MSTTTAAAAAAAIVPAASAAAPPHSSQPPPLPPPSNVLRDNSHVRNELQVNTNFAAATVAAVAANVKPHPHPHPPTSPLHHHHPLAFTQYGVTNAYNTAVYPYYPPYRYASYYAGNSSNGSNGNGNAPMNGKRNATGGYIQTYDVSRTPSSPYYYQSPYAGQYAVFPHPQRPSEATLGNNGNVQHYQQPQQTYSHIPTIISSPQQQCSANDVHLIAHMARLMQQRASAAASNRSITPFSTKLERMILDAVGTDKELGLQFVIAAHELLQQEPIIMQSEEKKNAWRVSLDGIILLLSIVRMALGNVDAIEHIKRRNDLNFDVETISGMTDLEYCSRFFDDVETKLAVKFQAQDSSEQSTPRIRFLRMQNSGGIGSSRGYAIIELSGYDTTPLNRMEITIDSVFAINTDIHDVNHEKNRDIFAIERIEPSSGPIEQRHRIRMMFKQPPNSRPQIHPNQRVQDKMFRAQLDNGIQATIEGVYPTYVEVLLPPIRTMGQVQVELYHSGVRVSSTNFSFEQGINGELHQHAEPNSKDNDDGLHLVRDCHQFTLLHIAAHHGYGALCKMLVRRCRIFADVTDCNLHTPLHLAVYSNQHDTVLALIEAGSSLSRKSASGDTAVDIARRCGHSEIIKDLNDISQHMDKGISPVAFISTTHPEYLLALLKLDMIAKLEELLSKPPHERQITAVDEELDTPLHLAIKKDLLRIVALLLSYGAPTNVVNKSSESPLQCAAMKGNLEMVSMLVERGRANVNLRGNPFSHTALHAAVYNGHLSVVKYLLDKGSDHGAKEGALEQTALHTAVSLGLQDIASTLVLHGANPALVDRQNRSSLDLADEEMKGVINGALQQHNRYNTQQHLAMSTLLTAVEQESSNTASITSTGSTKRGRKSTGNAISIDTSRKRNRRSKSQTDDSVSTPSAGSPFVALDTDEQARQLEKSWPAKILLKPSRRKHEHIDFFPPELCSSPYKYDIVVMLPHSEVQATSLGERNFRFRILVQVKDDRWDEVINGIQMIKMLKNKAHQSQYQELEWRVMYTVCSFHFQRKPFKLQVVHSEVPFEPNDGECDPDDDTTEKTPTTPASSPFGKTGQLLFPQHASSELAEGQKVVFESRAFWIVARKKKETYFWATRKFKSRGQNSPSDSSSEPGSPNAPFDVKKVFSNAAASSTSISLVSPSLPNDVDSSASTASGSLTQIPIPKLTPPSATSLATLPTANNESSTSQAELPPTKKQRLLRDHLGSEK